MLMSTVYGGSVVRDGGIRLVGGYNAWEGRVEIYILGFWGTISDYSSNYKDAHVVCHQLGYDTRGKTPSLII